MLLALLEHTLMEFNAQAVLQLALYVVQLTLVSAVRVTITLTVLRALVPLVLLENTLKAAK